MFSHVRGVWERSDYLLRQEDCCKNERFPGTEWSNRLNTDKPQVRITVFSGLSSGLLLHHDTEEFCLFYIWGKHC